MARIETGRLLEVQHALQVAALRQRWRLGAALAPVPLFFFGLEGKGTSPTLEG